jgi:hypothetical protein
MIELPNIGPFGQRLFPVFHEQLLELRRGGAVVRVAARNYTTLTGIMPQKLHLAYMEGYQFSRCAKETIFPKRGNFANLQIRSKTASCIFKS